ncbi:hypothetical protein KBX50_05325, partial [Micromonospora sp. C51]|uniref:hypothetical protein n=1 Tax=Micromonospora sp. C51 TaxID=2824879 RepID=UPI001B36650B
MSALINATRTIRGDLYTVSAVAPVGDGRQLFTLTRQSDGSVWQLTAKGITPNAKLTAVAPVAAPAPVAPVAAPAPVAPVSAAPVAAPAPDSGALALGSWANVRPGDGYALQAQAAYRAGDLQTALQACNMGAAADPDYRVNGATFAQLSAAMVATGAPVAPVAAPVTVADVATVTVAAPAPVSAPPAPVAPLSITHAPDSGTMLTGTTRNMGRKCSKILRKSGLGWTWDGARNGGQGAWVMNGSIGAPAPDVTRVHAAVWALGAEGIHVSHVLGGAPVAAPAPVAPVAAPAPVAPVP